MSFWGCVQGPGICSILDFLFAARHIFSAQDMRSKLIELRSSGNKAVVLRFQELEVGPLGLGGARRLVQPAACSSALEREDEWDIVLEVAKYRQRDFASDAQQWLMIGHRRA